MIEAVLSLTFVASVLRIAVPTALAALGGSITERSGMIDLALEAKLLFGAFACAAVGYETDSAVAGAVAGIAAGAAVAMVQAAFALGFRADQVIVGVALNIVGLGGTRFLLQVIYHEGANTPRGPSYGDAVIANPLVWLLVLGTVLVTFAVARTRWGLRLRAAGDRPEALTAVGASPTRARVWAALVGGALAGAGGAQLALGGGSFLAEMSNGRGYIALAMVILASWRPAYAVVACLGVALAEALGIQAQTHGVGIPTELANAVPYVATVVVLAVFGGNRRSPPRALGQA